VLAQNLVVLAFQKKGAILATSVTLDGSKFSVPSGEKAMMWSPPTSGLLRLTFESTRMPPKLDSCFPDAEIQFTLVALSKSVMTSQRRAIIELVSSSDMCVAFGTALRKAGDSQHLHVLSPRSSPRHILRLPRQRRAAAVREQGDAPMIRHG
jgi:hypothetical protein